MNRKTGTTKSPDRRLLNVMLKHILKMTKAEIDSKNYDFKNMNVNEQLGYLQKCLPNRERTKSLLQLKFTTAKSLLQLR